MMTESLETRWVLFCKSLGAKTQPALHAFNRLEEEYMAPTRHYHSLSHIQACLGVMDQHVPKDEWIDHIEMALWWHDFVYVPGRQDNEDESMKAMHRTGRAMGLNELFLGHVAEMIPYTKHNGPLSRMHDRYKYLVDVDLSILGTSEDVFDAYEREVRAEYAFVSDGLFNGGRAKILKEFLNRPFIFETQPFRYTFEKMARVNIQRSLAKLVT